jgi:plastocyanin
MRRDGGMRTVLAIIALILTAAVACSSPTAPASTTSASTGVIINLIGKNLAFDKSTITVSAGSQVTITFDNQDAGIPHNFAAYTDTTATTAIFVGETIIGPTKTTYKFSAPKTPGNYFFRCDVHPTTMVGTFLVTP